MSDVHIDRPAFPKTGRIPSLTLTIISEDGSTKIPIHHYHTRKDLMQKVGLVTTPAPDRETLFMGTTIFTFPRSLLEKDAKLRKLFQDAEDAVLACPLRYFLPQNDVVLDFLNDSTTGIKILRAGNGCGKSVAAWIDILLDIIPTHPSWEIFSVHGVAYRPYRKPFVDGGVGVVTYEWINHKNTLWPQVIQRWTPSEFLGDYKRGGSKTPAWRDSPMVPIADTPVYFMACSQADSVFESQALDRFMWDEQGQESKFNGANARIRRRNGRHVFALTPHKLEGRPDTGAGSWIHKLETGEMNVGMSIRVFHTDIFSIPDWIFSEKAKDAAFEEWVKNPLQTGNIKRIREGRSRVYGEYHETSGLVFDDWSREIHVVQPFQLQNVTRYRSIDHGRVNPTACIFAAVDPEGNVIIYDEYYEAGKTISQNVEAIIRKSGNERKPAGVVYDQGRTYTRYEEIQHVPFRATLLDSRSGSMRDQNTSFTIEQMYRYNGIITRPSSGAKMEVAVPIAQELFRPDPDRIFPAWHPLAGKEGAPRIFVFNTCKWFIWEIERYVNEPMRVQRDGSEIYIERPRAKDDHLMTALIYLAQLPPAWVPPYNATPPIDGDEDEPEEIELAVDPITGY